MPVQLVSQDHNETKTKLLTVQEATEWVDQARRPALADPVVAGILPMFLQHWNQTYRADQSQMFLTHLLEYYVPQLELLRGIKDLGERIVRKYPPSAYLYVGIGRSPAPLIAYFENQRYRTLTIPLSDFRPRNMNWSITDDALGDHARLSPQQQQNLFNHFRRFFPVRPARTRLLAIDYTQSAGSLIAAQEQLQEYFNNTGMTDIEVHALAICRDSDSFRARSIGTFVGRQRSALRNPVDWWSYSAQRHSFEMRWHVMPVVEFGEIQTKRQQLVMGALSGQGFDSLAEYGSYKILSDHAGAAPVRYTGDPLNPAAYDALREELANA